MMRIFFWPSAPRAAVETASDRIKTKRRIVLPPCAKAAFYSKMGRDSDGIGRNHFGLRPAGSRCVTGVSVLYPNDQGDALGTSRPAAVCIADFPYLVCTRPARLPSTGFKISPESI